MAWGLSLIELEFSQEEEEARALPFAFSLPPSLPLFPSPSLSLSLPLSPTTHPTIPLPLSVVSLQVSFIIHAAWQLLPCSRCLVWSLWFPPTTLTLVIPLISKQNHNISQLPVHPFIPPVSVVWGCLPVDSEREDEHSCILDPWRMPAKAAWGR